MSFALAVAASLGLLQASSQPPAICGLPAAARTAAERQEGVEYATFEDGRVVMDVYHPITRASTGRAPVVIFLNTSGRSQRSSALYACWANAAASRGLVGIVPDAYAKDLPRGFDALLAYLAGHADALRIDAQQIAVYAASGNVSAGLPLVEDPQRTRVKAAVIYYGWSDIATFRLDLPVLYVRAGLDRPAVNQHIDALVSRALAQNAPVTLLNYPGGHHAFEVEDTGPLTNHAIERTLTFLEETLSAGYQTALHARLGDAAAAGAMATGDAARAAALYGDLVRARPTDVTLRLSYGEALLAANEFAKARAQFDRLKDAALGPRDLGVPAAKASALDGDPDAAVAWLRTIPPRFLPPALQDDPAFHALRDRADFRALFPQR